MIPGINKPFAYVGGVLGAAPDELKLVTSFLLSYPLSGLLKRVPDSKPYLKNLFIIGVALFYLVGLFDLWAGIRTLFISSAGAYVIARYIDGPFMPWIGFVFLMGHMSINHIYRHMVNDASLVDITGAQMVLVMKLTAFCWNVHDGQLPDHTLSEEQKERALPQLPGLLDYAAFVLFFPSLFAGPAFDYIDYKRWIETSMFELPPGVDPSKAPPTRKKRKIPRSGTPSTYKAIAGLGWIFAFLQLSPYFDHNVLLTDDYRKHNFFNKIFIMHMVGMTTRLKYYGVWTLTEGACILSGIGYKGVDPKSGRPDWGRLTNVNPLGVELAQNSRAYLGNWNINTNNWLRNYIYLRVTPRGKKPGFRASMATFVTSAFWHGFEPGYYLAFILASFIQTAAKNCRRFFRPFFLSQDGKRELQTKKYYDFASWLATHAVFSFTVVPFYLLSTSRTLRAWSAVYYYGIALVLAAIAFFASPAGTLLKKRLNARNRPPMVRQESAARGPALGMPEDPVKDIDELLDEIRELRQAKDQSNSAGVKQALEEKLQTLEQQTRKAVKLQ